MLPEILAYFHLKQNEKEKKRITSLDQKIASFSFTTYTSNFCIVLNSSPNDHVSIMETSFSFFNELIQHKIKSLVLL
jgi:hypothetical protein